MTKLVALLTASAMLSAKAFMPPSTAQAAGRVALPQASSSQTRTSAPRVAPESIDPPTASSVLHPAALTLTTEKADFGHVLRAFLEAQLIYIRKSTALLDIELAAKGLPTDKEAYHYFE